MWFTLQTLIRVKHHTQSSGKKCFFSFQHQHRYYLFIYSRNILDSLSDHRWRIHTLVWPIVISFKIIITELTMSSFSFTVSNFLSLFTSLLLLVFTHLLTSDHGITGCTFLTRHSLLFCFSIACNTCKRKSYLLVVNISHFQHLLQPTARLLQ